MNLISESRFKELMQGFKELEPLLVVGDIVRTRMCALHIVVGKVIHFKIKKM